MKYRFLFLLLSISFFNICKANCTQPVLHFIYSDSVAVTDSMTIAVAISNDSTARVAAQTESLIADSTIQVAVQELDTLNILNPFARMAKERKHFIVTPITANEYDACVKYYKEHLPKGEMQKAYNPWKSVFNSNESRSLSLYNDGVPVLLGCVSIDTLNQRYDNIGKYCEELVELYDIAIENIDDLNAQIDFNRGGDSITVAELRSQQYYHYINLSIIDSIFNSSHHNSFSDENRAYWKNAIIKDPANVYKHYAWLHDIVYSDVTKIHSNQLLDFSIICKIKMNSDINKYNLREKNGIRELLRKNAHNDGVESVRLMHELVAADYNNAATYLNNISIIENDFAQIEGAFIDNQEDTDNYYETEIAKNNGVIPEWIIERVANQPNSKFHFEGLRQTYDKNPSYQLAIKTAKAAKKLGDALNYYEKSMAYDEFKSRKPIERADIYVNIALKCYTEKQTQLAYSYCKKALDEYSDYHEAYTIMAEACAARLAKKEKDNVAQLYNETVQGSVACFYYNKAIESYERMLANGSADNKTVLDKLKEKYNYHRKRGGDYNYIYTEYTMKYGAEKAGKIRKEGDIILFEMNKERIRIPMKYPPKSNSEFWN